MSPVRIFIGDDEALARTRWRRLVSLDPDCQLVGEYANGGDTIAAYRRVQPDLVFLDVQMPGMDGFEVARAIAGTRSLVILVSAHADYALRAFEADVFDYLLKPFGRGRFYESLRRAKARLACERPGVGTGDRRQAGPVTAPSPQRSAPDRIAVKKKGSMVFVKLEEVDWFGAADNYVMLHRGRETHLVRATMMELESKLDPARFLRVHRSAIVNLDRIKELRPWFRGDYLVILRDGTELRLSKNHRGNLEAHLLLGAA